MGHLTGKTAIITGGGRAVLSDGSCGSIGYGIATAYAKKGANIVITGRNVQKLEDAKEELERLYGIQVLILQADVNAGADNEAVVANVVKKTIETFGRIDVLVNNAQASASGVPIAEHTTEQFNLAMYSGVYAAFYYMKACYPYLKESKGSVINFASGAGLFGNFGQCAYAAAKELRPDNASGAIEMSATDVANRYWACIDGIAAKEMDKTIFVGGTYTSGGVTYSGGGSGSGGGGSAVGAVLYNMAMNLNEAEKALARQNIGAAAPGEGGGTVGVLSETHTESGVVTLFLSGGSGTLIASDNNGNITLMVG